MVALLSGGGVGGSMLRNPPCKVEAGTTITYDPATGRIADSNLKSKLTYPNEAVVTWSYEPHRDLLTAVTNATYSTYVYTNDLLGRRTSKNDEQYGYNVRDELISADEVSYAYDDIGIYAPTSVSEVGNRTTAEGKTYTANNLNQYTAIDDFVPQYDDDGNQTLIKTETGVWSVTYNAENRPIRWESGDTVITMSFDRMGRRVEMRTVKDGVETLQRFVYDNYLCIQQLRGADNALFHSYIWDPTEPIATRPLVFLPASGEIAYYFHDGNKNVSDLVDIQGNIVHYSYTPFGIPTAITPSENSFCFSSEHMDNLFGLVYYNYRHYNHVLGRWIGRDKLEEENALNLYMFSGNTPIFKWDIWGLACCGSKEYNPILSCCLEIDGQYVTYSRWSKKATGVKKCRQRGRWWVPGLLQHAWLEGDPSIIPNGSIGFGPTGGSRPYSKNGTVSTPDDGHKNSDGTWVGSVFGANKWCEDVELNECSHDVDAFRECVKKSLQGYKQEKTLSSDAYCVVFHDCKTWSWNIVDDCERKAKRSNGKKE